MGWRVRVFGSEHVPKAGAAVLASNHIGYLDFVFIGYGAREQGRLVRFMAKKEVFRHPIAGPLMRGMKHIPVDRYADARQAIDVSVAALRRGEVVGMFPEGTISRSFVPRAGKTGAARMAMEAGVPLIPCATWGTQRILTKDRPKNFERKVGIDVYFGEPISYATDDDVTVVTKQLMDAIGVLVETAHKNYPQQPASAADGWWLPAHLGGTAPTVEEADALDRRDKARRKAERAAKDRR
ncbi:MAG TPA: lysophospholipid acyltransferase family protein [Actinomycetota bacterium]|nr:lysophospholipid acyltransferase family protein [Actinomycetota bacterium]